jgi:hypothetical protein
MNKKNVVQVFLETTFKECVMYCCDEGIISKENEKEIMLNYYKNEDEHGHNIIVNFFDDIGISDEEFYKFSMEFEGNYNYKNKC